MRFYQSLITTYLEWVQLAIARRMIELVSCQWSVVSGQLLSYPSP